MKRSLGMILIWILMITMNYSCTSGQVGRTDLTTISSGKVSPGMTRLEAENILGRPVMTKIVNDHMYRSIYLYEEGISFKKRMTTNLLLVTTAGLSSLATSPVDRSEGSEHYASLLFQRQDSDEYNDMVVSITSRFKNSLEAMIWQDKSMLNIRNSEWEDAIRNSTRAISIDPELKDAYMGRAIAYYESGQYMNSIFDCSKVLDIESDHANAFYYRGMAYEKEGLLKEAKKDLKRACKLNLPGACDGLIALND